MCDKNTKKNLVRISKSGLAKDQNVNQKIEQYFDLNDRLI